MFIDTHAHLNFPEFSQDLPEVVKRAEEAGISKIITIATDLESARSALEIATNYSGIYAVVGLHPGAVPDVNVCDMGELQSLAGKQKIVGIGETGLDYYRLPKDGNAEKIIQQQKDLFWAHLDLAQNRRLPVVIHNRAADDDLLEIMQTHACGLPKEQWPWGVVHCFSGDDRFAFDCIEIGLMISYTGILTFKSADALRETAKKVPLDKVMLETDAPYLTPVPHRGKRNEPSYVPLIGQVLAEVKDLPMEEVAKVTSSNAQRFFQLG